MEELKGTEKESLKLFLEKNKQLMGKIGE